MVPPAAPPHTSTARRDLLVLATLGLFAFAAARWFALFDRLVEAGWRLEGAGVDALIVTILALAFGLTVYAWRRWWEARRALAARLRAEGALRASEARLRLLTRQLPAFLWTTDAGLRLTAFAGGGFRRDGIDPLRDAAGAIVGTLGLGVEVTEREQAEAALRASEARYRAVVEQATEGIFLFDAASKRLLEANPAFCRLLGYAEADLDTLTLYDVVAHDRASIDANTARIGAAGQHLIGERAYRRKDGSTVVVEVSATALATGTGATLCVIVRDSTARQVSEVALRASEAKLQAVVRNAPVLLFTLDGAGTTTFAAGRGLAALGHPPEGVVGWSPFADTTRDPAVPGYVRRALAGEMVAARVTAVAACLFHVAQEALRNALIHAQAHQIRLTLAISPGATTLRVADDGTGFVVPPRLSSLAQGQHFGLIGLAERVEWAEGKLIIVSTADAGTVLTVQLPRWGEEATDDVADPGPIGR